MKKIFLLYGLLLLLLPLNAHAAELITNGGFETGSFTGWTVVNNSGYWIPWSIGTTGQTTNDGSFTPVPTTMIVQQGTRVAYNGIAGSAGSPFLLSQDVAIPAGFNVRMTWIDRYQLNYTQFCSTTCGTATYAVEILNTSNVLLQTLYTVTTLTNTNTNTGYVNHTANLSLYGGQTIRIRFRASVTVTFAGPGQLEVDAVSVQTLTPTAANASVGGRVSSADGTGLARVTVTMTGSNGVSRSATTNSFGYYKFDDVPTGDTYIVAAGSKKYLFPNSPRVVSVQNDLTDVDFAATP
ncbi:MAG: carboxypeptidase regulatory-like domain-containing protein [Acidobacteria bacterium]|nr:carboxypeptidase regulatory-like domain-containing protein [Acidobacteriota bacterium]